MSTPVVASIGTTHPWNIAGVGLDARVMAEYGATHVMAIVAVSAQDSRGLRALSVVPPETVRAQLEALPRDINAFRVGALVSSESVRIVAGYLRSRAARVPIVVDPVIGVTLGGALQSDSNLLQTLQDALLSLPVIVTPNVPEAERLLGTRITNVVDARAAARALVERGARAALIKGGHLEGEPADVLATADEDRIFTAARLPGSMRGSGCTLAASLAAELAFGRELPVACENARRYVRGKIAARRMRGSLQVAF